MENVKAGEVIVHSYNAKIAAVSIAESDAYTFEQPEELKESRLWLDDGWRVDIRYIDILNHIKVRADKIPT